MEEVSKTNLEKPLLIRNDNTSQLTVNFDAEVYHKYYIKLAYM